MLRFLILFRGAEREHWPEISSPLKRQPKVVKHTKTVRWLLSRNCVSVFDHFVGLALKGLTRKQGP